MKESVRDDKQGSSHGQAAAHGGICMTMKRKALRHPNNAINGTAPKGVTLATTYGDTMPDARSNEFKYQDDHNELRNNQAVTLYLS
jgi:hypothetical protein